MASHFGTDPLGDDPLDFSGNEKRTLIAIGTASALIAVLTLLGARCVIHHSERIVAYLLS